MPKREPIFISIKTGSIFIGNNIKVKREELGLHQAMLGIELGMSQVNVSQMETGKKMPTLKCVMGLSRIFNCTIDELVKQQNQDNKEGK